MVSPKTAVRFSKKQLHRLSRFILFLNVLMRLYFNSLRDRTDVIAYHVDPVTWSK